MTVDASLTRVTNTLNTYVKAYHRLTSRVGPHPFHRMLDFGAGFGHGGQYFAQAGHAVDWYDTSPPDDPLKAYLTDEQLADGRTYDLVFAVYVLNVVPPVERKAIVQDVSRLLSPGGIALYVVRGWYNDVQKTKTGQSGDEVHSLHVPRGRDVYTYQKGFAPLELEEQLDWYTKDDDNMANAVPLGVIGTSPMAYQKKGDTNP